MVFLLMLESEAAEEGVEAADVVMQQAFPEEENSLCGGLWEARIAEDTQSQHSVLLRVLQEHKWDTN